jgi:hypothetical protein
LTDRKNQSDQREEFGMEFGNINAIQQYDLGASLGKKEQKQKKKGAPTQKGC